MELGCYHEDKRFTGINGGETVMTGFGHGTVLSMADKVIDAVKTGVIKHFFLVAGCDDARTGRNYYTEFVEKTPADTVILTLACGKYRFNNLDLGTIGGLQRLMDMGQCNDAYSAIKVAGVTELIRSAGADPLYLPPYSPDFNPIEKMWSKLKALFRKLKLRSLELLTTAIPTAFTSITSADSRGWFSLAGYETYLLELL